MFPGTPDFEQWQKLAQQVLGTDFMHDFFVKTTRDGPRYNMYRNSSEIIILIELPYLHDLSKIKLLVRDRELILKGKLEFGYEHMEVIEQQIFTGMFEKKIVLPDVVNTKKVNAQYQKGILKVQLFPKLRSGGYPISIQEL